MVTIYTTVFNIQKFYVQPTQCIYVFCVDPRTNSDYFPVHYQVTGLYNRDCGYYMYHQFNIQQFYFQAINCIYVFCVDLRTNSVYFPIQH
jgi:hypothetical protein